MPPDLPHRRPARVLFISHDGGRGGAQRTLLALLAALDRQRFEPYLVVPSEGELSAAVSKHGVSVFVRRLIPWLPGVHAVPRGRRLDHLARLISTLPARSWAIANLIVRNQIDLVYTNTITCVEGAIAARMAGKPHVWHIHEPVDGNAELTRIVPSRVYSWFARALSTSVIFPSRVLAKRYLLLAKKATVVYNGLPVALTFDRACARNSIAMHFEIDPDRKLIAVVGALHPRKDHFTFLAAAQRVLRETPDAIFLIVGGGSKQHTKRIHDCVASLGLSSSVKLPGWWPDGTLHNLFAALDVLVIFSEQESFGLTAIEALAVETPVVSTRCGGPEEIVRHGLTGLLVAVHHPVAMAEAIVRLLKDVQLARGIRRRR